MPIVERMFAGTDWLKDWLRNAAGGAYSTAAGLTSLPIQAAMAAQQLAQGKKFSELNIPDPLAGGKKAFSELTGLPVDQAEPGFKPAFGFGRGAAMGPTVPAAIVGGGVNALAETVTENPLYQAAINVALPLSAVGAGRGVQALRQGTLRKVGDNVDSVIPLTKGQAQSKGKLLFDEDFLASHPKTADRVAAWKRNAADAAKTKMKTIMDVADKTDDAEAGLKAALAWKRFEDGQLAKHNQLSRARFEKAIEAGGNKSVVDIAPVKKVMEDLYEQYAGKFGGDDAQAMAQDLQTRLKNLSGTKKVTLQDVQSQLEELGQLAQGSTTAFGKISPGTATGVARKLKSAWDDALDIAAAQPTQAGAAAKLLKQARLKHGEEVEDLKALADTSLGVFFDVGKTGERILLEPEKVMEKLRNIPKTQRDMFVSIMDMTDSSVTDSLRKNILGKAYESGKVSGANVRQPSYSASAFLKGFEKIEDDLSFLLPDKGSRENLKQLVHDMRRSTQSTEILSNGGRAVLDEVSGMASIAAGKPGAGAISRGIMRSVEDYMSDKDALFDLLFTQKTQPATTAGRLFNTFKEVSKQTPFVINRELQGLSGLRGYSEERFPKTFPHEPAAEQPTDLPPPPPGFWDDEQKPEEVSSARETLLRATSKIESGGDPKAVSPAGAVGEYQFMPKTAEQYGIDPTDPAQSKAAADKHYQYLLKKYDGDLVKALAAYNWGEGNVDREGLENMPEETRNHVQKMLKEILGE